MSRRLAGPALVLFATVATGAPKPAADKPAVPTEVHVVVFHEGTPRPGGRAAGGTATVHVDRPDVEVTLVLSAYNPIAWDVTASPKTKLVQVILAGYHRQTAAVPKGAPVADLFHEGRDGKPYLYLVYKIDSARFRPGIQALNEMTKQEVRSFQGAYRFDPASPPIVNAIQDDPRLSTHHPRLSRAADLPKVAFRALHFAAVGHDVAASYGDFTQDGPRKASLKPLPDKIRRLAHDPQGKKYYGLTAHEVHEVDLEKRTSTKLDPSKDVPSMSWPQAIAFDTKRDRLLVIASHSLIEYAPATGKWAVVAELPRGIGVTALAYHPKDDVLYGLGEEAGGEDGGRPVLRLLNAQGAVLKSTPLGDPMFPGVIGRGRADGRAQLVSAGNHLAVVFGGSPPRDGNGRPLKAESFLYLIDPETEKVTLGWKE